MTLQTLKMGKEKWVVMRERDYKKLLAQVQMEKVQEAGDLRESRRRMKEAGGVSLAQMKKKLGL